MIYNQSRGGPVGTGESHHDPRSGSVTDLNRRGKSGVSRSHLENSSTRGGTADPGFRASRQKRPFDGI